jgi:hypothetical protein
MPLSDTRWCPECHGVETTLVGSTLTGVRHLLCVHCGNRWNLTVEDEVLGYTSERRKATTSDRRSPKNPESPFRQPAED